MFLIFLGLLANLFFEYPCTTHATQLRHARRGPHLFAQRQIKRWLCFYMATNDMQLNRTRTSISGLSSASQSIQMVTCHQQDSHSTSQIFPNYSTPRKSCGHGLDRLTISGWKPAYVMHRLTESVLQILSTMWLPVVSMLCESVVLWQVITSARYSNLLRKQQCGMDPAPGFQVQCARSDKSQTTTN